MCWTVLGIVKGDTLLQIHKIYHFKETAHYDYKTYTGGGGGVYSRNILTLNGLQVTPEGVVSEEDKDSYLADYLEKEGILFFKEENHQIKIFVNCN